MLAPKKKQRTTSQKYLFHKKAYKLTNEETREVMRAEVKQHFKLREPEKRVPVDLKAKEFFKSMNRSL